MGTQARYTAAIASSYFCGYVGSLFVGSGALAWYTTLVKPPFTPASWVFFPVWIILYGLMGIAMGAVWSKTPLWYAWNGLFYVSLAFNAAWTMFFFGLHTVFIALVDIGFLLVFLITLTLSAWKIDHRSTYLLLPYLGWVLFATYLNTGIWLLN